MTHEVLPPAAPDLPAPDSGRRWSWLTVLLVIVLILLVLGGVVFTAESVRQHGISTAMRELEQELALAQAELGPVADWREWYISRIQGTWGGDELTAWAERAQAVLEHNRDFEYNADFMVAAFRGKGDGAERKPDAAERAAYLAATDAMVVELDAILARYEDLSFVPGVGLHSGIAVIPILQAHQTLQYRAMIHPLAGDMDAAWVEFERMADVVRRRRVPAFAVDLMVSGGIESMLHETLEWLCMHGAPPTTAARFYPWPMDPRATPLAIEGELVSMTQLMGEVDDWREYTAYAGWFAWFRFNDMDSLLDPFSFTSPRDEIQLAVDTLRNTREAHAALKAGRTPASAPGGYDLHHRLTRGEARTAPARQRAQQVLLLRQAEAKGLPLRDAVLDTTAFPDLALRVLEDGSVEITYELTNAVRNGLDVGTREELERAYPPTRLKPLTD
jgi:hypothetical protein